jgi:hypothetical protein
VIDQLLQWNGLVEVEPIGGMRRDLHKHARAVILVAPQPDARIPSIALLTNQYYKATHDWVCPTTTTTNNNTM